MDHMIDTGIPGPVQHPWDYSFKGFEREIAHARCLSLFARGTYLQYWQQCLDAQVGTDIGQPDASIVQAFNAWWPIGKPELSSWGLEEFFCLMANWEPVKPEDKTFIRRWLERMTSADSADALLGDPEARELIRRHEEKKRPGKRRLCGGPYLDAWTIPTDKIERSGVTGNYELTFRAWHASRIADDIVKGLGR